MFSLSLPARSLWRALGRAGEEVLEMRRECEGGGGVVVEDPVVLKNQKEREEEVILVMSCVEDGNC